MTNLLSQFVDFQTRRQFVGRASGGVGVAALAAAGAPIVVLVSCDPVAGARDVRGLIDAGYRIDGIEVLDLFPQPHHLEVVSRLVRE